MIYISGPMSGYLDYNWPAFEKAYKALEPHAQLPYKKTPEETLEWAQYMKKDIKILLQCDAIVMLEGWEKSDGACLERQIASALGYTIYESLAEAVSACK